MKNRIFALITLVVFLTVSCSGIYVSEETYETPKNASGVFLDNLGIEFTGNPAYDIGLLNAYWDSQKNTESKSLSASRDAAPAINGFGDLVNNFSGKALATWAGGVAASGAISTVVGGLVGFGFNALLEGLGIVKSTSTYLAEISGKLDSIQKQLNTMQTMLEELNTAVAKESSLTRYYTEMQKRNEKYIAMYQSTMTCWNNINDFLFLAALKSQYPNYQTTEKDAYNQQIATFDTNAKRLTYLQSFVDRESWLNNTDATKINLVSTLAGTSFNQYFTEHAEEISLGLAKIVDEWGKNPNTGADAVKSLCEYLTSDNHGLAGQPLTMFELYDAYADACFVWEREGYNWRQQIRDQDATLISMSGILASMYYAIHSELGLASSNAQDIKKYEDAVVNMYNTNKIIRHSTPVYTKWGKWRGRAFAKNLETKDYQTACNVTWCCWDFSTWEAWFKSEWCKYTFNDTGDYHINNASRIYGVYPPPTYDEWKNLKGLCKEAVGFAMPEEWYKEMYEAYKYTDKKTGVVKHKSLIEIFRDAGFYSVDGKSIAVNIPTVFNEHSFQQLFITNKFENARIHESNDSDNYYLTIPAVWANREESLFGFSFDTGISDDHTIPIALFYGKKYYQAERKTQSGFLMRKVIDPFKNRHFYYPKMLTEAVEE